jgi:hypothetical protein
MGSIPEPRYCARGELCVAYKILAEPTKLSRYAKDNIICSSCLEAERDAQVRSVQASMTGELVTEEMSRAEHQLAELKLKLVAHLALRRGEFWELVRDARAEWNITPETRHPPAGEHGTLYPKEPRVSHRRGEWEAHLEDIKGKIVPLWPDPVFCTRCYESVSTDSSSSGFPVLSSLPPRSAAATNSAGLS